MPNFMVARPALALLSLVLLSLSLPAGAGAYLQLGSLKGGSTEVNHVDWIELLSITESITNQASVNPAGGTSVAARVQFGPLQLVKLLDTASVELRQSLAAGTIFADAVIEITSPGKIGQQAYFRYELKNVRITSISMSAAGDSVPVEDFALNFEEIKWIYTPQGKDGSSGGKIEAGWDIKTGKSL